MNNVRGDIIHSDIGTNSVEKAGRSVFLVNILMAVPKLYGAVTVFQRGESRWWLFTLKGHPIWTVQPSQKTLPSRPSTSDGVSPNSRIDSLHIWTLQLKVLSKLINVEGLRMDPYIYTSCGF